MKKTHLVNTPRQCNLLPLLCADRLRQQNLRQVLMRLFKEPRNAQRNEEFHHLLMLTQDCIEKVRDDTGDT